MVTASTVASSVGAGVGQVRSGIAHGGAQAAAAQPAGDVSAAALALLRQAFAENGTTGHDLDMLA